MLIYFSHAAKARDWAKPKPRAQDSIQPYQMNASILVLQPFPAAAQGEQQQEAEPEAEEAGLEHRCLDMGYGYST